MKKPLLIIAALVAVLAGLFVLLIQHDKPVETGTDELLVHCSAGLQKPVSEIAKQYEKEFGTRIKLNFAGSGVLESQLEIAGGDLYIPADFSYIESTRKAGLVQEALPIATLRAVIVVPKGNPANIRSLSDLKKTGVRLCSAEPSAAVGKYVKKILTKSGDWDAIKPQIIVTQGTVNGVVETVASRAVDAAIAWDAVALQFDDVEIIRLPLLEKSPRRATVGVLKKAKTPAALHFARYMAAQGKGGAIFVKRQFAVPEEADQWADVPELVLFSGFMLKPAIQDRVREFELREGCRISTSFEGCGTLVSMMQGAGVKPSAYFSCDSSFLTDVQDQFHPGTVVTSNEIILLVPKGNPKNLTDLKSLTRAGLKVGLADGQKSALGKLSRTMLQNNGLTVAIKPNVVLLASKGDELVNHMQANALDAALLYRSNAMASKEIMKNCDIVPLNDPCARATQPFAISKTTPYPAMMQRLLDTLLTDESQQQFLRLGFQWEHQ